MIPRTLPFAAYVAFLALGEGIVWVAQSVPGLSHWAALANPWLYPVQTAVVLGLLLYFWPRYEELKGTVFKSGSEALLAFSAGLLVYVAWVRMDWPWAMQGAPTGYDPFRGGDEWGTVLAGIRLFGAVIAVPIMEELFWRSFLLRYFIEHRFETVRVGTLTPFSCLTTIVLFGLEHHLWLAGMLAGAAYTFVLYRTGRLWPCILAHAATNLALGVHVLVTKQWQWW